MLSLHRFSGLRARAQVIVYDALLKRLPTAEALAVAESLSAVIEGLVDAELLAAGETMAADEAPVLLWLDTYYRRTDGGVAVVSTELPTVGPMTVAMSPLARMNVIWGPVVELALAKALDLAKE